MLMWKVVPQQYVLLIINNYFKCSDCSKKMSDEINGIVDFNNIESSMINVENYFKNHNGTCE